MIKKHYANQARLRRHQRVRKKLAGTTARPRLAVFRSSKQIYVQIIDDERQTTLVAASSREAAPEAKPGARKSAAKNEPKSEAKASAQAETSGETTAESEAEARLAGIANNRRVAQARAVGRLIAERAQAAGIKQVVFDRGGYLYHGRVAALAAGAREGGLDF